MAREQLVAAVDGGGSGSRLLLFDRLGRALASFDGPPLNYAVLGPKRFLENLRKLLDPAKERFGSSVGWFVFSLAGVSAYEAEVEKLLRDELQPARVALLTDVEATYLAAARGRDAIVVSSGTGSFAYGRRKGAEARAGGWGYIYGDEGSAYWMGREFVRRLLMFYDGRLAAGDISLRLLLAELGVESVSEALSKLYREYAEPSRVAELAKLACKAAELGCSVARSVIEDAAGELERMVSAVERRLGFEGEVVVYGTGGAILGCKLFSEALKRRIESGGRRFVVVDAKPVIGCVIYYLLNVEGVDTRRLEQLNVKLPGM